MAGNANWTTSSAYVYTDAAGASKAHDSAQTAPKRSVTDWDIPPTGGSSERRKSYQAHGVDGVDQPAAAAASGRRARAGPGPVYAEPTDTLGPGATVDMFYNATTASAVSAPSDGGGGGARPSYASVDGGGGGARPSYASVDYGQMDGGEAEYELAPPAAVSPNGDYDKFGNATLNGGYDKFGTATVGTNVGYDRLTGVAPDAIPAAFYSSAVPQSVDASVLPPASPRVMPQFDGLDADYTAFGEVAEVGPEPNYSKPDWIQPPSSPSSPLDYGHVDAFFGGTAPNSLPGSPPMTPTLAVAEPSAGTLDV